MSVGQEVVFDESEALCDTEQVFADWFSVY